MNAIAALLYADRRALANDWRRIVRSPGRLAIWALYGVMIGFFAWSRMWGRAPLRAATAQTDVLRADFFLCVLLLSVVFALMTGRGAAGIFRSRAEARFVVGSPVPAPVAIAYLQVREALAQGFRLLFSFLYLIVIFGPRHIGPAAIVCDVILLLAVMTAGAAIVVPRRLLPPAAGFACAVAGVPLALLVLAPALRDFVTSAVLPFPPQLAALVLRATPAWHPGSILLAANPIGVLAAAAIAAAAIGVLASAGRDAYPELYALSVARIDRLESWRRRADAANRATPRRRPALRAPSGVLIFVWKSIVEFQRRTSPRWVAGGALLFGIGGFVTARFIASDEVALVTLVGVLVNVMLVANVATPAVLAGEIRRPLFWLAPAPLFERLCALAAARIWRTVAMLEIVAAGFALGGGRVAGTLVFAVALPAFVALLAGVGLAVFAFFPSAVDARGPLSMLRLTTSLLLAIPPFIVFSVLAAFGSALGGLAGATTVALVEAGMLVGIAAWRLDGRIDRVSI